MHERQLELEYADTDGPESVVEPEKRSLCLRASGTLPRRNEPGAGNGRASWLVEAAVDKSKLKPNRISMPTLTIKGVPPELHEKLKERAERHRRSMNNELLTILERTLTPSRKSAEEAIAQAQALNDRIGTTFDSTLIEEKKREGLT